MQLYLSSRSHWNSNYTTAEGQIIYKVDSPFTLGGRTTTIKRVTPNSDDISMRDSFAHLAQIEFHTLTSSRIRYDGKDIATSQFFRKEGWGWYGKSHIFAGPDGKEYKWKLGVRAPELFIKGENKTPVACFHRHRFGILDKPRPRPASLEIFPAGEHMVDLIVITFIYIEKLRKDRERASQSSGG